MYPIVVPNRADLSDEGVLFEEIILCEQNRNLISYSVLPYNCPLLIIRLARCSLVDGINLWTKPLETPMCNCQCQSLLPTPQYLSSLRLPLPNVTWHSGTWPYTMTPSIDQTLHQFANLLPNWTLIPILTLLPNFGGFHRTLQRVRLANRGRLLLRTPGPVPFGTCICSNVETILSWTCHIYGPFEFRTSLGTSILLLPSH